MTTKRATKATRAKLERALELLESFHNADDIDSVIGHHEQRDLWDAIRTIQTIESRIYNGMTP